MMKKIAIMLVLILTVTVCVFSLAGCDEEENEPEQKEFSNFELYHGAASGILKSTHTFIPDYTNTTKNTKRIAESTQIGMLYTPGIPTISRDTIIYDITKTANPKTKSGTRFS